ncbi:GIN domain-containing protein [Ochrovirga pacifica]|uniref:GIN domain-containing protein n=1 Tax=Ochrovirga pacifica TaxID=1042376 RepID=UPI0002559520|nr:DUF2807 domain-containing protein [Ochrovirga pacifica]
MKHFLLLLFATSTLFSQKLERNLKEFKSIEITSAMDVELIIADDYKVVATGNDTDNLIIENKNHELDISSSLTKKFNSDIKLKIYYKPGLRHIKLSNNVVIHSKDILKENFLEFIAINNINANLSLETVDLIGEFELGSNIVLKGTTESQKIKVLSKSKYKGFAFKSKKAYVKTVASEAELYVTEFLEANARLKGTIIYDGDPFSVVEKSFLGGIIRKN